MNRPDGFPPGLELLGSLPQHVVHWQQIFLYGLIQPIGRVLQFGELLLQRSNGFVLA